MNCLPDLGLSWNALLSKIPSPTSGRLYFVGGWVRDLILLGPRGLGNDIDLVTDGDLEPWARSVASQFGVDLRIEPDFLTARIVVPQDDGTKIRIDMARFRKEHYEHPGELPRVQPGSLEDDAGRRDFSMNAIFLEWSPRHQKIIQVIDLYKGREDLRRGIVDLIRDNAFREDPTRILRWARLSVRLGLDSSQRLTSNLERTLLYPDLWNLVGGARVNREMERIMSEPDPLSVVDRLVSFQVFRSLGGMTRLSGVRRLRLRRWCSFRTVIQGLNLDRAERESLDREMFYLALLYGLSRKSFQAFAGRLGLGERMRERLRRVLFEKKGWPFPLYYLGLEQMTGRDPGRMRAWSDRMELVRILFLVLTGNERDQEFWKRYLEKDRWIPPLVSGEELLRYPTIPPAMRGALLAELRELQRTGVLKEPSEAKRWIEKKVSEQSP